MNTARSLDVPRAFGPDGTPVGRDTLPPPKNVRWGIYRKAQLLAALRCEVLSVEEACRIYSMSVEELTAWKLGMDQFGLNGLRVTRGVRLRKICVPDIQSQSDSS